MKKSDQKFEFDLFISYSTKSDYRLARRMESFLESFHRTHTGKASKLRPLQVCLDGSDFFVSEKDRSVSLEGSEPQPTKVPEIIENYLNQCRMMVVLCSPESMQSQWVKDEISYFLCYQGANRIMLAITHGEGVEKDPEKFFAPELVQAGLHESLWYDFRGFYQKGRQKDAYRDFDSERLRLVATLHGKSASTIEPLWTREKQRAMRIRYFVSMSLVILTLTLSSAVYIQKRIADEETEKANIQTSMQFVSQTYRYQYANPFHAVAKAYEANFVSKTQQTKPAVDSALASAYDVLLERRKIAFQEKSIVKAGLFSFIAQSSQGQRYTKLSPDGKKVLVVTERKGDYFQPELKGNVYIIDNRTLHIVELADTTDVSRQYRLEFAGFAGKDKVLIGRGFHLMLYNYEGKLLANFQLKHTKTPITAAGGMLEGIFFIAGNGGGCVWAEEYGSTKLITPSVELSSVSFISDCDDKFNPDALVSVIVDSGEKFALNLFESGRTDVIVIDGNTRRAKRLPVIDKGGVAVAFCPDKPTKSFAFVDSANGKMRLTKWDINNKIKPRLVDDFSYKSNIPPINYLGFSEEGKYLVCLDTNNVLHIWNYETMDQVFSYYPDNALIGAVP